MGQAVHRRQLYKFAESGGAFGQGGAEPVRPDPCVQETVRGESHRIHAVLPVPGRQVPAGNHRSQYRKHQRKPGIQ